MKNLIILITLLSATALFADNTRDRGAWCHGNCSAACHEKCMKEGKSCDKSGSEHKKMHWPWQKDNSAK